MQGLGCIPAQIPIKLLRIDAACAEDLFEVLIVTPAKDGKDSLFVCTAHVPGLHLANEQNLYRGDERKAWLLLRPLLDHGARLIVAVVVVFNSLRGGQKLQILLQLVIAVALATK